MPGVKESDGLREETVTQPGGSASDAPVSLPRLHGRKQAVRGMGGVADEVAGSADAALVLNVHDRKQRAEILPAVFIVLFSCFLFPAVLFPNQEVTQ